MTEEEIVSMDFKRLLIWIVLAESGDDILACMSAEEIIYLVEGLERKGRSGNNMVKIIRSVRCGSLKQR